MPAGPDGHLVWGLAAALLIGALVGIEREKKKSESEDLGIGGVRTFILFALAGAVAAWLSQRLASAWVFVAPLLGIAGLAVAGYLAQARIKPRSLGLTTEVAAVTVYLLAGLSLIGYVATRALGPERGAAVTGLAGGLVSSTAVTLTFARQSREDGDGSSAALASGLLLAWGIMFVRVLVEVAVVHVPLVAPLLLPMGAMGLVTLALAAWFAVRSRAGRTGVAGEIPLRNPFSLTAAFKFALFFAAVLLVVKLAQQHFPGGGYYVVAALAGLADVDAITLSMADLVRDGGTDVRTGVTAIVVASLTNTAVKCGMIVVLADAGLRRRALVATILLLLAGLTVVVLF